MPSPMSASRTCTTTPETTCWWLPPWDEAWWTLSDASNALTVDLVQTGDLGGLNLESRLAGDNYQLINASLVTGGTPTPLFLSTDITGDMLVQNGAGKTLARVIFSDRAESQLFSTTGRLYVAPAVDSALAGDAT